jgi:hypothetical protein
VLTLQCFAPRALPIAPTVKRPALGLTLLSVAQEDAIGAVY